MTHLQNYMSNTLQNYRPTSEHGAVHRCAPLYFHLGKHRIYNSPVIFSKIERLFNPTMMRSLYALVIFAASVRAEPVDNSRNFFKVSAGDGETLWNSGMGLDGELSCHMGDGKSIPFTGEF